MEGSYDRPSRRSRRTRRDLLSAARSILEADGVDALTVRAVTDLAGVAHGTFYHHFSSTEAVLAAGLEESMREFSGALQQDLADADDKAWVFVASLSGMFRMLASHAALGWMLERPRLLATSLRETCAPFARRDLAAMVAAGDVPSDAPGRAGRYWEWILVGALVDAAEHPAERPQIEARLLDMLLRIVGVDGATRQRLLARAAAAKERQP